MRYDKNINFMKEYVMIEKLPQSNGNNLAYKITGKVSIEDEQAWIKSLDEDIFSIDFVIDVKPLWQQKTPQQRKELKQQQNQQIIQQTLG